MFTRSKFLSPVDGDGQPEGGFGSSTPPASSQTSSNSVDDDENDKGKFVSRESYERMQKDLHRFKSRARESESKNNEYETEAKARAETKLLEEKNFQQVIDTKNKEIEELNGAISNFRVRDEQAAKYSALTDALGQRVPDKFLPVIPLDDIKFVDGQIDLDNLKEVAGRFKTDYPEIFKRPSSSAPGDFPQGTSKKMSKSEYEAEGRAKGSKWMQQQIRQGNVDFR